MTELCELVKTPDQQFYQSLLRFSPVETIIKKTEDNDSSCHDNTCRDVNRELTGSLFELFVEMVNKKNYSVNAWRLSTS